MSFSDAISSLTEPQLRQIIRLRRAVPLAEFVAANGKARQACALRHKGWMDHSTIFVNAMILACKTTGIRDALEMATLMSAVESYAIGLLAREDLTLNEYNLLISCIAQTATPEIILKEQTWTPDPLPQNETVARQNYQTLKEKEEKRGRRTHETDPDPDGDLVDTGIDANKALAALLGSKKKPQETPVVKVDSKTAISKMMEALKKKPVAVEEKPEDERVRIETASGGGYQLVGIKTGTVYGGPFDRPAEAVVHATRNRMKLGANE